MKHYPQVAEHITTVAKERYHLLKMHEQSVAHPDITVEEYSKPDLLNQNDDQERSEQLCLNQWLIINPESYIGLTLSAVGHILVLFTSLILPYQVNYFLLFHSSIVSSCSTCRLVLLILQLVYMLSVISLNYTL